LGLWVWGGGGHGTLIQGPIVGGQFGGFFVWRSLQQREGEGKKRKGEQKKMGNVQKEHHEVRFFARKNTAQAKWVGRLLVLTLPGYLR